MLKEIPLGSSPDNVVQDRSNGDLWVGCHPIKFRLFSHLHRPKSMISPSQILRIRGRVSRKQQWTIMEPYASDGASLSGSTVAIRYNQHLLIGSMHDKLLKCDLLYPEIW